MSKAHRLGSAAPNGNEVARVFDGKCLLIVGGSGSIGRALVHEILTRPEERPRTIRVISRTAPASTCASFASLADAADRPGWSGQAVQIEAMKGDVRDYSAVLAAVDGMDIIIHGAAMRDIPACEYSPGMAVTTNCLGADNIARAVRETGYQATHILAISSAKACSPTSVMGMTKALEERIFVAANAVALGAGVATRFFGIRLGNVLGSAGSVVPLFRDQISGGGPVTVTDAQMTRFVTTFDEAVEAIMSTLRTARPGEIVVPRPVSARIIDIARSLIGDRNVGTVFTGARPGERTHELLVSEDEFPRAVVRNDQIVIRPHLLELCAEPDEAPTVPLGAPYGSADCVSDQNTVDVLLERAGLLGVPTLRDP